jgi:GT2 family glycosyltransferase
MKQTCSRISFAEITEDADISSLLEQYREDYFVFSGKEICVLPEYLYEIAKAAAGCCESKVSKIRPKNPSLPDLIYTDEDNRNGGKRLRPFFKPDADLQMLLNFPYLGRCYVVKRSLLETLVQKGEEIDLLENDWYDLSLRAFRYAEHIFHIPKPLFSNLVPKEGAASFVRSKSGKNKSCLNHYLESESISAKVIESDVPGFFHLEYDMKEEPLISIIIPNKDHIEDLALCLASLKKSDYQNYEVIIAENNSEDPETFAFYDRLMEEDQRIHTVTWEGGFNYSAINNFAAESAKGDLFLFLNNDTEFMEDTALRQLAVSVSKPGVGAAGAMLYYGDSTIQHGGVIIGMGGFAAHALWSLTDRDEKYYPFSLCEREMSAVTGACLMVRRSVFEEVGGMEEEFVVALNDVDFCMKIRSAGYRIIWNPYAKLYHYESKSRGYEDTMEKQARFQSEIDRFQKKWERELKAGDPYYNPNLTLHRADYSMDV